MAGFMKLQVWLEQAVYVLGDCHEVYRVPESYVGDLERATDQDLPVLWWAHYTAPGYMDRTDPVYGKTAFEACKEAFDLYGDPNREDECNEYVNVLENIAAAHPESAADCAREIQIYKTEVK